MPLKRHSALTSLSHDHHHSLLLANVIREKSPAYKGFPADTEGKRSLLVHEIQHKILPHFDLEESVFRSNARGLSNKTDELLDRMLEDHRHLRKLFRQLTLSDTEKGYIQLMDQIGESLEKHIRFEERELFMALQNTLSEEKMLLLGGILMKKHENEH